MKNSSIACVGVLLVAALPLAGCASGDRGADSPQSTVGTIAGAMRVVAQQRLDGRPIDRSALFQRWRGWPTATVDGVESSPGSASVTLHYVGGPTFGACKVSYEAGVVTSAEAIVVYMVPNAPYPRDVMCDSVGYLATATVDLGDPVGDRTILDLFTGETVPKLSL